MGNSTAKYLFQKRGIFYFERRIPQDLQHHYSKKKKIVSSLRTKKKAVAISLSTQLSNKLEIHWFSLRVNRFGSIFCEQPLQASTLNVPSFSDAVELYLKLKGAKEEDKFFKYTKRSVAYLISASGDKPLDKYTRNDANNFRDSLIEKGLVIASVKRNFHVVRAVFNVTGRETGLEILNPFSNINYGPIKEGTRRSTIPVESIRNVQKICFNKNDDIRWLIALLSDTGMRLAEACGLAVEDLRVSAEKSYVVVRSHQWRRLKTKGSERIIPLVGASLWAATQIVSHSQSNFAFPRYCSKNFCKSDYASSALNKWLRRYVPKGCVIHSFRHSFRDRLRNVGCPSEVIDQLGGWATPGIGQRYGVGYPLETMSKFMSLI